ncbi:MAG: hypothetical protein Q8P53_00945 [Candidatus Shapirobacteria bacterium]|nr:hypothetical protein [Candidatus Shapirobacteria bacterium]
MERENTSNKETVLSDLQLVVDLVAGKDVDVEKKDWVAQNISSIREATKNGRHSTIYYPASGEDMLRVLYAYDADHLIAVDPDEQWAGNLEEKLQSVGIQTKTEIFAEERKREITFELDGKERRITRLYRDARQVDLKAFGFEAVDVLHIYAPTGADVDITEEELYLQSKYGDEWIMMSLEQKVRDEMATDPLAPKPDEEGRYKIVIPKVREEITAENCVMVSEGGFFVFGERGSMFGLPPTLLKIVGLEMKQIVERHPQTVQTSFYPKEEELKSMDRRGDIYHKIKTVSPDVIKCFEDASGLSFGINYRFFEFKRGDFQYMGIDPENNTDIVSAVNDEHQQLTDQVAQIVQKMKEVGVNVDLVNEYRTEVLEAFKNEIFHLQYQASELLVAYKEVSGKRKLGEIDDKRALKMLGIGLVKNKWSGVMDVVNNKWPLASQMVFSGENKDLTHKIVKQLAGARFEFSDK